MHRRRYIRWMALFMLVTFAASFTVFCHCEKVSSCCEKKKKDDHGCQGMAAVKFNLREKQAVAAFQLEALTIELPAHQFREAPERRTESGFSVFWSYKHSPPNRQSLYQCFLI